MRIRLAPLLLLASFCLSCSNNTRNAGVTMVNGDADFDSTDKLRFEIEQTAFPMTFRGDRGATDVSFRITITNRMTAPVTVKRLTLQSMGGGSFRLETSRRKFDKTIAPGAKESFKYWAPAVATDLTANTRVPLVVRTTVDAVTEGTRIREVFNRRLNDEVSVDVGVAH
jgi:hypothetical protein